MSNKETLVSTCLDLADKEVTFEVIDCLEKLAVDNVDAQFQLGYIFAEEEAFINYEKAIRYLTPLADNKHVNAMVQLGLIHFLSKHEPKDYELAFNMFFQAGKLGHAEAYNFLGIMFEEGVGIEVDDQAAHHYYIESLALGGKVALGNLEHFFEKKFGEGETSKLLAIQLLDIAMHFEHGRKTAKDLKKAFYLYETSAKLGNATAMSNLAIMYVLGKGVDINYQRAHELLEKAVEQNFPEAYNNLGYLYQMGHGVPINLDKAVQLYEMTLAFNNKEAIKELYGIYQNGYGGETAKEKADYYKQKANELGLDLDHIN